MDSPGKENDGRNLTTEKEFGGPASGFVMNLNVSSFPGPQPNTRKHKERTSPDRGLALLFVLSDHHSHAPSPQSLRIASTKK